MFDRASMNGAGSAGSTGDSGTAVIDLWSLMTAQRIGPADSPATAPLRDLLNGIAAYAAIAAVAAVLVGGICWALGDRLGLDGASTTGRRGVFGGCMLAFLIGMLTLVVNVFIITGGTTQPRPDNVPEGRPEPPAVQGGRNG